jgi:DNA mismatch repair protein MutL
MLALRGDEIRCIRVLPPEVVERIAAGEVVERPVSVVRELIDNALDAGGTHIDIELVGGGLELIRISDNGHGIPADQVELAFAHHATSKIGSVDDLRALQTLGFRGEALPSIAAVAQVSLASRTQDATVGTLVVAEGATIERREQTARQPGTTVTVHRLFARLPARRKFLGSAAAESARIISHIKQLALGHPGVRLTLTVDGRVVFASRGLGDARAALADVLGMSVAASLRPFRGDGIEGFISPRSLTRSNRGQLILLVNGRLTGAPGLLAALEVAYRPILPRGRHPIALIRVTELPENVDPNVHPSKTQVRLRREPEVGERLTTLVRELLAQTPDRPTTDQDFALGPRQLRLPRPRPRMAGVLLWDREHGQDGQSLIEALVDPRSLTQIQQALVLVEADSGLFLVDQHRAHERVIYERLRNRDGLRSQTLLEPIVLELRPQQLAYVLDRLAILQALGFDCEHLGGYDFLIRAIPAIEDGEDVGEALPSLLAEAAGPEDQWQARLLGSIACRAAVRRGRDLGEHELRRLLSGLAATATPSACPHGSPVMLHFSGSFLRRQFRW